LKVMKALYGAGQYKLVPALSKHSVQPHEWEELSATQKKLKLHAFIKDKINTIQTL